MARVRLAAGTSPTIKPTDKVFIGGAEVNRVTAIGTVDLATITYQIEDANTKTPATDSGGNPIFGQYVVDRADVEIDEG